MADKQEDKKVKAEDSVPAKVTNPGVVTAPTPKAPEEVELPSGLVLTTY